MERQSRRLESRKANLQAGFAKGGAYMLASCYPKCKGKDPEFTSIRSTSLAADDRVEHGQLEPISAVLQFAA
jgi:hypothetical protein